jgi:hypothetical protein
MYRKRVTLSYKGYGMGSMLSSRSMLRARFHFYLTLEI